MATNKHAQIRYTLLDRCFSNYNRKYTYDALLEEINKHLHELGTEGIKRRQLLYDIEHMESDSGWAIELAEDLKDGKKRILRYKDKGFSIANHPLNVNDTEQLETSLAILSRYKHRVEFSWLEELLPRMEQAFNLVSRGENGVISYQENVDLKGREHIGVLFNLILKRKKAKLIYQPYGKPQLEVIISPYHLKQFNNRWFLFSYSETYKSISNYPLDRIVAIEEQAEEFKPVNMNWIDYFDDFIGVTKPEGIPTEVINLRISQNRLNYILTKPLHSTQKTDKTDETGRTISINVIPNRELYQLLLSYGADVEVVSPCHIRKEMKQEINKMYKIY